MSPSGWFYLSDLSEFLKASSGCAMCGRPIPEGRRAYFDRQNQIPITCSDDCHEKFVYDCEQRFGAFKKVIGPDGIAHKVPTRTIIEQGLKASELHKLPRWDQDG